MDLINNELLNNEKAMLLKMCEIKGQSKEYKETYKNHLSKVQHWKYATDEYYNPIPFYNEINKFKKGRISKATSLEDAFQKNLYAFGFRDDQQLILTLTTLGQSYIKTGIQARSFIYQDKGFIYETCMQYPNDDSLSYLIANGHLFWLDEQTQIDINVGANGEYSISAYVYEEDKVLYVDSYSKGWNGQTRYDFEYNNNDLSGIKIGGQYWWKAKGTK